MRSENLQVLTTSLLNLRLRNKNLHFYDIVGQVVYGCSNVYSSQCSAWRYLSVPAILASSTSCFLFIPCSPRCVDLPSQLPMHRVFFFLREDLWQNFYIYLSPCQSQVMQQVTRHYMSIVDFDTLLQNNLCHLRQMWMQGLIPNPQLDRGTTSLGESSCKRPIGGKLWAQSEATGQIIIQANDADDELKHVEEVIISDWEFMERTRFQKFNG